MCKALGLVQHKVDEAVVSGGRLFQIALRFRHEAVKDRARAVGQPLCPPGCFPVAPLWIHAELVAYSLGSEEHTSELQSR